LIKKLAYSIGAVATALSYQAFSTYIIFFYVDVMKLPAFLAGVAMVFYAVWNAVNDPLAGYLSDRTRTRWGRRIPWIAGGAVPFGIVYYLLWVPPFQGVEQPFLLFLYFLFIICLFDGLYSFTILNWSSLYPEMYPGLEERAQVNSFRQSFGMIGLVIGISLPPLIYGRFGWPWMGALFGSITAAALLITLFGSFEKKQFSQDEPLGLKAALKATFKNRSFLSFVFANLLVQYTFTIILATIPFFAKYILGSGPLQTSAILAAAFLTAIPMLFVWRMLTVKFGAKYCFMASMLVLAMALVPLLFAKLFIAVLITAAFIGSGLAGFILVADLIISDIIDEDEVATGTRREGMFFGMSAFVARFAIALEAASMSSIFLLSGYNPFVFTQTGAFNSGLRLLIAGLPILAMALAFVIMLLYPLAGKKLEGMRVRLAEMHTRKGVI
jgi:GPH family glycoside/pentoside/hexuronide:cation symporter